MDNLLKLILLFFVSLPVFAVPSLPTFGIVRAGVTTTYTLGPSTFQPIVTAPTGTGLSVLNSNFSAVGSNYASKATIPMGEAIAAVRVTAPFSAASLATAAVKFAKSPWGTGAIIVGSALWNYFHDNGLSLDSGVLTVASSSGTSTADTYPVNYSYVDGGIDFTTAADSCSHWSTVHGFTYVSATDDSGYYHCTYIYNNVQQDSVNWTASKICRYGGTVFASSCINAPACVSPQVRLASGVCGSNSPTPISDASAISTLTSGVQPVDASPVVAQIHNADTSGVSDPVADGIQQINLDTSPMFGPSDANLNPGHLSSPQSNTTAPTVTATPDGKTTSTTTTTTITQPSTTTISSTSTTTATTTNVDNSTTTTNIANAPAAPPTSKVPDPKTDCDKDPLRVGCLELGTVPVADVIPVVNVAATLSPTSLGSGSCPADNVVNYSKGSLHFSYRPMCDMATGVSPFIIALAWLAAGMLVLSPVRG